MMLLLFTSIKFHVELLTKSYCHGLESKSEVVVARENSLRPYKGKEIMQT